jgi:hypothetical protein
MIKLDGLQFSGKLQALSEGVLPGLEDFVMDLVSEAAEEQLVLEKLRHVIHPFKLGLDDGGGSIPHGSHGGAGPRGDSS